MSFKLLPRPRPPLLSYSRSRLSRRWNSASSFDPHKPFTLTSSALPEWKPGDGVSKGLSEHDDSPRKTWILDEMSTKDSYKLLTSAIIPRPIAFISTIAQDGTPNLAPFSYFSMISHNPPLLSVSFNLSPRRPKDTRENILATKEFTVNIISEHLVEAANATAVEAPADVDEWIVSGLTMEPSLQVKPACVKESLVSMECKLHFSHDISDLKSSDITNTLVLGLIKQVHVTKSALTESELVLDPAKLRPVARLGGNTYARLTDAFDIPRPAWKMVRDAVQTLTKRQSIE
ncbi:hypothetical protein J3R30DRAFT_1763772 [Lentinula aciculospora]|uniref:Flavin reductase like domain-containing protein n=1 Tax=Lentinula aciculospora TaxID=153920 RepID=A0A9W9AK47_9AGAR|nr:hypothetical protein J3R30DRAFT_1763772 [Lentinula aciculospora]